MTSYGSDPTQKVTNHRSVKGHRHAHGCIKCDHYYEDYCETPKVDDKCIKCQMGHCWELLRENREPHDCCFQNSERAEPEDTKRYKLAGTRKWFICRVCARCQVYLPHEPKRDGKL